MKTSPASLVCEIMEYLHTQPTRQALLCRSIDQQVVPLELNSGPARKPQLGIDYLYTTNFYGGNPQPQNFCQPMGMAMVCANWHGPQCPSQLCRTMLCKIEVIFDNIPMTSMRMAAPQCVGICGGYVQGWGGGCSETLGVGCFWLYR